MTGFILLLLLQPWMHRGIEATRPPAPPPPSPVARLFGHEQQDPEAFQPHLIPGILVWTDTALENGERERARRLLSTVRDMTGGRPAWSFGTAWSAGHINHYRLMLHTVAPDLRDYRNPLTPVAGGYYYSRRSLVIVCRDFPPEPVADTLMHEIAHHHLSQSMTHAADRALNRWYPTVREGLAEAVAVMVEPEPRRSIIRRRLARDTRKVLRRVRDQHGFEVAMMRQVKQEGDYAYATTATLAAFELHPREARRLMAELCVEEDELHAARVALQLMRLADRGTLDAWCALSDVPAVGRD